jgi:hypothetical protein
MNRPAAFPIQIRSYEAIPFAAARTIKTCRPLLRPAFGAVRYILKRKNTAKYGMKKIWFHDNF